MGSSINVNHSTVNAPIVAAETISNSFNASGGSELLQKLQALEVQFAALQKQLPAHQQEAEDCASDLQEAQQALRQAQPDLPKAKKALRNVMRVVAAVSGFSGVVESVKFVMDLLDKAE